MNKKTENNKLHWGRRHGALISESTVYTPNSRKIEPSPIKIRVNILKFLVVVAILWTCALSYGWETFTKDIIVASGAEVSAGAVKINVINGDVDIAYKNASGQVVYRGYTAGVGVSNAEIVDSSSYTYWIGGIGRGGADGELNNKKIKIGYCRYYNLIQASKDAVGTGWILHDTGNDGVNTAASGAYALNPSTGLSGFVSRASNGSAFYMAETGNNIWGSPVSFLDAASGATYPDIIYGSDGLPYIGVNYGLRSGVGPAPWVGISNNPARVYTAQSNNYYHSALAECNGIRYFVSARTNAETKLYYTDTLGNWVCDGLITATGYYGDNLDYAMAVSPAGKIAVILPDKRTGDTVNRLYLATKNGLGGGYSWNFTPLTGSLPSGEYPDVKYDDAGNLYVAYYDSSDDALHLKTTFLSVTPEQFMGGDIDNDSKALYAAAQAIYNNGSGELVLAAGHTYQVGYQTHINGQYPYYKFGNMFKLSNSPKKAGLWVVVKGNGAILKVNNGLKFGSFDKNTGAVYNPSSLPFIDLAYRADVGYVFYFDNCTSVRVRNLTIDGSASSLDLGGYWGDSGRQCVAYGLNIRKCDYIRIENLDSSHNGLDGLYLYYNELTEMSPSQDWAVLNCSFEYNGRQGMSIGSGKGLVATNCKFNHTGRGGVASNPCSGVDIEAEGVGAINRNHCFNACDFVNNAGCGGMVADSGDSKNVTFNECLFWGTTNFSAWPKKPGFKFYDCTFHGQLVNAYGSSDPDLATQFENCHFEDVHDALYDGAYYSSFGGNLMDISGENVLLDSCTMVANQCKSVYLGYNNVAPTKLIVKDCSITHNWENSPDHNFLALILNTDISNTVFHEVLGSTKWFYISQTNNIIGQGLYVDGPRCKWGTWGLSGITGAIPPTP